MASRGGQLRLACMTIDIIRHTLTNWNHSRLRLRRDIDVGIHVSMSSKTDRYNVIQMRLRRADYAPIVRAAKDHGLSITEVIRGLVLSATADRIAGLLPALAAAVDKARADNGDDHSPSLRARAIDAAARAARGSMQPEAMLADADARHAASAEELISAMEGLIGALAERVCSPVEAGGAA